MRNKLWKRMGSLLTSLMLGVSVFVLPVGAEDEIPDKHIDYQIVVDDNESQAIVVDSDDVVGKEDDDQNVYWEETIPSKNNFLKWMRDNDIDPDNHDIDNEEVVGTSGTYNLGEKVKFTNGNDEVLTLHVYTEVTLTFKDGDDTINSQMVDVGHTPVRPEDPIKAGSTFDDWYADKEGTKKFDFSERMTGDQTVYAKWKAQTYTITYDLNQGAGSTVPVFEGRESFTSKDDTFSIGQPTRDGYTFDGWTGSNGSTPEKDVQVEKGTTQDLAYTANWTPVEVTYDVLYQDAGGKELGKTTQTGDFDSSITLQAPDKKDYITPEPQTVVFDSLQPKQIVFVYRTEEYSITYDYNGGDLPSGQTNPTRYTRESSAFTLYNPEKEGYTFKGWSGTGLNGDANTKVTVDSGSTGDRAYTAHYTPNAYTIHFDANKANGKVADIKTSVDETVVLPDGSQLSMARTVSFETNGGAKVADMKASYAFVGWKLGDTVYAPGQSVANLSTKNNDTVTLQAQWDGTNAAIILPQATNGDMVFDGWYEDATLTKKAGNAGDSYAPAGDMKLYAKWKNVGFVVKGEGAIWTKGTKDPLEFTIQSEEGDDQIFSHFEGLYNGEHKMNKKAFTATQGSVKLSVQPEFLETLKTGPQTFTAKFDDGRKVDMHFTIQPAKVKKSEKTNGQKTGTQQPILLWGGVAAVAAAGVFVALKKKQS